MNEMNNLTFFSSPKSPALTVREYGVRSTRVAKRLECSFGFEIRRHVTRITNVEAQGLTK